MGAGLPARRKAWRGPVWWLHLPRQLGQFLRTPQVAVRQLRQPVRESDALFGRQLLASRRFFQQRALASVGVTSHQGALAGAVTR
jgi:hypothetical protein